MSIILTQTATNNGSSSTPTITLSNAISVGDCIVFTFVLPIAGTVAIAGDPTDTLGNNYGGTSIYTENNTDSIQIWSYAILSGFAGAGTVITGPNLGGGPYRYAAHARVYSGVASPVFIDDIATVAIIASTYPHVNNTIGATSVGGCKLVGFYGYRGVEDPTITMTYSDGLSTDDLIRNYDATGTIGLVSSDSVLPTATTNTLSTNTSIGEGEVGAVFGEYALLPLENGSRRDFLTILGVS